MIYPEKIEEKIGFDGVRGQIEARCQCGSSRDMCAAMSFMTDFSAIKNSLAAVAEMVAANHSDSALPLSGINDIKDCMALVKIPGTFLELRDLIKIRRMLGCFKDVSSFFKNHGGENPTHPYPVLAEIAECLDDVPPTLTSMIDRCVDESSSTIKDTASPTLADIRRQIRSMSGRINSIMRRVLGSAISQGLLEPDTTPSVRDGRLVIPVPPMNKRKIQGIVHDESASGKTTFIEPAEVVEANNMTRELQLEEHREIIRILTEITDNLRPHISEILTAASAIYHLDFINAKARYADDVGGIMPHIHDKQELEWYHACHPVLKISLERQGRQVVPIDITLNKEHRILVISGPNAGGKSVCLKTVGTLQYMMQCGLLPPVYENSHFGIFNDIFVDIGDDQSFEDDLSTYSSHLKSMKFMLQRGRESSLFLIDEMGSGTEPQIGGALAQAILDEMNRKTMWGIVTTHYQNLKHFADETDGLVNGSMLYDRHLMQPMFKLSIGNPGSSFAVEIARKTGLPAEIIAKAEGIVGSDYINLDNYLLDITRDKRYWENKRTSIRQKEKKLEQLLAQYSEDAEQLRSKRREIIEEAKTEAKRILDSSNASIERTIADIKAANAEREKTLEARRKLKDDRMALEKSNQGRDSGNSLLNKAPKKQKKSSKTASERSEAKKDKIEVGSNVRLDGGDTVGKVLEISGNNAIVIFGNLRTSVKVDRLSLTMAQPTIVKKETISRQTLDSGYDCQLQFKQEIDLRGMRADEAIQAVTYFIDDAIRFSVSRVRILHGTGTGALRQAVRQYLSTVPGVETFHDEDVRFGGAGITVVNLK